VRLNMHNFCTILARKSLDAVFGKINKLYP
jgi:hypothetical protein